MSDFMTRFFGPLTKEACLYFKIVTVLFFVVLMFTIFVEILFILKNYNKLTFGVFVSGILLLFNSFMAYFVNRLLYTMCSKSLA